MRTLHLSGRAQTAVGIERVTGAPGAGVHKLSIELEFTPDPYLLGLSLFLAGDLRLGSTETTTAYVGRVSALRPAVFFAFDGGRLSTPKMTLVATLLPTQLELVEAQRRGGDVALTLDVDGFALADERATAEIGLDRPVIEVHGQLPFVVAKGEWERLLESMRWAEHLTVQVRLSDLPRAARAEFTALVDALRTKPPQDVVRDCRVFMESHLPDDLPSDRRISLPKKHLADKEVRFQWVRQSLKTVADASVHGDETTAAIDWTYEDARSMVTLLAALLHRA